MRASYVVIFSIVLGAVLGTAMSWVRFHDSPALAGPVPSGRPSAATGKGKPKVLVDLPLHDFGAVERDTKAVHVFKITNLGDAPLELEAGDTTCTRCTITKLEKSRVEPGETTGVRVEYLTTQAMPRFRQHATILTNDPEHPSVDLTIFGTVMSRFRVIPDNLVLSKISANEGRTAEVRIYAFVSDEISVEKYELVSQDTAEYFDITSQPIPRDQLTEPKASSACRVLVTVKPGLPLGPIRQTIRLELKMGGGAPNAVVEVPIEGTVDSDISIVGVGWNADAGRLAIGEVASSQGAKRDLRLVVRGSQRNDVKFTLEKVDPAWLKVSLGAASELNSGVMQIPLSIEIPPGSPPMNRLGSDQGKYAEVVLDTTHPLVRKIRLYLQFVILQ